MQHCHLKNGTVREKWGKIKIKKCTNIKQVIIVLKELLCTNNQNVFMHLSEKNAVKQQLRFHLVLSNISIGIHAKDFR